MEPRSNAEEALNALRRFNALKAQARRQCAASRTERAIKPALLESKIVVCDRYNDSGIAYVAVEDFEVPNAYGLVKDIAKFAATGLIPDMTFSCFRRSRTSSSGRNI